MEYLKLCDSDYRFMMVVWEHAPVSSGTLVKLCNEVLGWKKSTTYTTIKKLSEKGYIKNENAIVSVLIEKERVQRDESAYFVERTFGGSLPQFFLVERKFQQRKQRRLRNLLTSILGNSAEGRRRGRCYIIYLY